MWLFAALATGLVYYSFAKHVSGRCPSTSPTTAQRGESMWLNAHRASVSPYVNWHEWFCSPLRRASGCPGEGPGSLIGSRAGHRGGYWASQHRFEAVATIFKSTERFLSASPRAFTGPWFTECSEQPVLAGKQGLRCSRASPNTSFVLA